MLKIDDFFHFALSMATTLSDRYPQVNGVITPYRPASYETEGVSITLVNPADGLTYRINFCGTELKNSICKFALRLSRYGGDTFGTCKRFTPISKRSIKLNLSYPAEGNIQKVIDNIVDFLKFIEYPLGVIKTTHHKDPLTRAIEKIMDESLTYKFKTPPAGSLELDKLYDYVFNELHASWCGRIGHYAYADESPLGVAEQQDGFIYCYCLHDRWLLTAAIDAAFIDRVNAIEVII